MRHLSTILSLSLFLALASSAPAVAAPFTNGSFEESIYQSFGPYVTLPAGSAALPGWSIANQNIDHISWYWEAADGSRSLDLNGNSGPGLVSQVFDTLPGVDYYVRFAAAGNPQGGPDTKSLLFGWVTWLNTGPVENGFGVVDITHAPDTSVDNMGWTYYEFAFRAIGENSSIYFLSLTVDPRYGPALDDVSVTAMPEPSSMILLASGLAAVACRRRSRRAER